MRRLALVGGGHAHVEIVRRWAASPVEGVELTVVDPRRRPVYSGMVPGFIAGEYRREEVEIDLQSLCLRAGARYLPERAKRVDAGGRRIELESGSPLAYDVASLDIGSTVAGRELPGVEAHVLPSRPIPVLMEAVEGLVARAGQKPDGPFVVHVVGGGAGGVEVAFCLEARLRGAGARPRVTLVSGDDRLLAGAPDRVSRAVARAAAARGIASRLETRVAAVTAEGLVVEGGERLASDAVLWVTGPAAHPLARESDLPVDDRGFVATTRTLQVAGHLDLFAVGDCASLPGARRAGVYAVRAGPVLDHNLRAFLDGSALRAYEPQRDFLSLLNLGDGTAIGAKWGLCARGRLLHRLKDRIDRSFVQRYAAGD